MLNTNCQVSISTTKQATVDAVTQLAKHSKKIAFVSGPLVDDINGKIRLSGYKEALKAKKIEL